MNLFFQVAQVEGDDFRIVHQVAPLAGVGVAALVEDVAAVADLQAAAGVLFDDDHGYAGKGRDLMNDPKVVSLYLGNLEEEVEEEGR